MITEIMMILERDMQTGKESERDIGRERERERERERKKKRKK